MKKRFLIPAVVVGGFTGLVALGATLNETDLAQCNNGDAVACVEAYKIEANHERITNQKWLSAFKESEAKRIAEKQKLEADRKAAFAKLEAEEKARKAKLAEQNRIEAAKFKAEGWWEIQDGIFIRWCDREHPSCPGNTRSYTDYTWRAMVWCKERACGDIYARMNISQNGTVVGWTNETAYGGYNQKVVLTFGSYTQGSGRIVEFRARG